MSLFTSTVEYYRRYRPGIPPEVAAVLMRACPDRRPRRLLDVGTGTGLVVEALIEEFDDIVAIDNDGDMLVAAESALAPLTPEGTRLVLRQCAAEDFTPAPGWQADLVTICRAFHWIDQAAVLDRLDHHVASEGAVAIFGDNSFWAVDTPWSDTVRAVVKEFLGEQRRAGQGTFQHHNRPYSEIMEESAFSQVAESRIPVRRTWTCESILGYLYSTSFAAPRLFGERQSSFEETLRERLAMHSVDGTFVEDNEFLVRIGRRPGS